SSLYPKEISSELLDFITSEERIAPHFHISLQSGSNRILSLMGREYRVEEYMELVEKIVSRRTLSAIGTDIIVGFPTEEDEDFIQTYTVLENLPIAYMHIFPYSDRPFTKASKMEGKVLSSIKEERVRLLRELDKKKREVFRKANTGREVRAVVLEEGRLLTENYIEVEVKGCREVGKITRITLIYVG
ncbi:MAG: radical SAM protein, partial [Candidatus Kryptonium sp.]